MLFFIYGESIQAIDYGTEAMTDLGGLGSSADFSTKGCPSVAHLPSGRRRRFEQYDRQKLEHLPADRHLFGGIVLRKRGRRESGKMLLMDRVLERRRTKR